MKKVNKANQRENHSISPKRAGIATGITAGLLYGVCVFVVMRIPTDMATSMYSRLFHGLEVSGIVKTTTSVGDMLVGLISFFVIGWLVGATFAAIYNLAGEYLQEDE